MSIFKTKSSGNNAAFFTGLAESKTPVTKILETKPPNEDKPDPQPWKWDAEPKYTKGVERMSDIVSGASFTTDAAAALGLFASQQTSVALASQLVGTGAGFFRLAKGGLEIASGIQQKRVPYIISGGLDLGIGVCTLLAGFAIAPIPTILIAAALLGMRIAYDEMIAKDSIVVMSKAMKKVGKTFANAGGKIKSIFKHKPANALAFTKT